MVRPKRYNRRAYNVNLDVEIIEKLDKLPPGKRSEFINLALRFAFEGPQRYAESVERLLHLENENAVLKKENEALREQVRKMEKRLVELERRWGNQAKLADFFGGGNEAVQLVQHLEDGLTITEVFEAMGIFDPERQLKMIKKYWRPVEGAERMVPADPLLSGWELRREGTDKGFRFYTLRRQGPMIQIVEREVVG